MSIPPVRRVSPVGKVTASKEIDSDLAQSDALFKMKDRIASDGVGEGHLQHQPPVLFTKEEAEKVLSCLKKLFPQEKGLSLDGYLAKFRKKCESIKSDEECLEATGVISTICEIAIKSPSSHVITPQIKDVITGGVAAVSCIGDLSTALRSICDYTGVSNPLMSSVGLTTGSNSFAGLISAVGDFKRLLEAYRIGDREGLLQGSLAVLMDVNLSGGGFAFLVERFASMGAAAGSSSAAQVSVSTTAVGLDLFAVFYMLIGVAGVRRLGNLAWHREDLGIDSKDPKNLAALEFFKKKLEITPTKVLEELNTKYGKNLNEALKKEARLQAKTICWALEHKGRAPGVGDFIAWGKDLMGFETSAEKSKLKQISENIARAPRGKENDETLKKLQADYPQLRGLDQEALQGLCIVCSRMESRINQELARLTSDAEVLKVQHYVEAALNKEQRDRTGMTESEIQGLPSGEEISRDLRTAYWKKVRESAGLVVIGGVGLCVMVLSSLFNPLILTSAIVFLNAFMAYGYDYQSVAAMLSSKDPLKPCDKAAGWAALGLGLVSVVASCALLGASIASFGALPLAVTGIVLTVWLVTSCYNLYNLHRRERFWNENEKIWQGQTVDGLLVRTDAPRSLYGRVKQMKQDEFAERVSLVALHKIAESIMSKEKKDEAISRFNLHHSINKVDCNKYVDQTDLDNACRWFREVKEIIEVEEERLAKLLLGEELEELTTGLISTATSSFTEIPAIGLISTSGLADPLEFSRENSVERDGEVVEVKSMAEIPAEESSKSKVPLIEELNLTSIKLPEEVKIPKMPKIPRKSVLPSTKLLTVSRVSFPALLDPELDKKIAKTKGHIARLERQLLSTKSAGAGRQKKVSLREQIEVHQKRLKKLENGEKSS